MTRLRTDRLELDPFGPNDLGELHALFTDADVRRYLLDDELVPLEWTEVEIRESARRFGEGSAGLWAVRPADDTAIIGFAGFRPFFDPPELQLLYGLLRHRWGEGLATEASREAMRHAFEALGFRRVTAAIDEPNVASARVLERLGLREVRRTGTSPNATIFFIIDRTEWKATE